MNHSLSNDIEQKLTKEVIESVIQIAYWNNLDLEDDSTAILIKAALTSAANDPCWDPVNEKQLTLPFKIKE